MTECNREGCEIILAPPQKKYCSISCAAKVNNKLYIKRQKRSPGFYRCAYCNKRQEKRNNTMNKYRDNVCQQNHRKQIRNEKIERDEHMGKSVGKKRLIIAYLKDTNQWYCHQCKKSKE